MPEVRCLPDDIRVKASQDDALLAALLDAGVPIAHACGGRARCSTCRVRILRGFEACSPRTEDEARIAERLKFPPEIRLACQTTVAEDVRLQRLVLDDHDIALSSQQPQDADVGVVGRDLDVAVLFTDVRGYTALAEALPAYDIVHLLNRFFDAAGQRIEAVGGRVDNYMGDALMALFGLDGQADAAWHATQAGGGILEAAHEISCYLQSLNAMKFSVGVGVHYGPVVVGALGARGSRRETAIGDTVNLASRIESANKVTGTPMLVSQAVRDRVGERARWGGRFEIDVRGKTGKFVVHEVAGLEA